MKDNIVGRQEECERLMKYLNSAKSEFIAIYGRRRIGKTFLVRELFDDQFSFKITGKEKAGKKEQLKSFQLAMAKQCGIDELPEDWDSAFALLAHHLEKSKKKQKIIFFDELPWFDVRGSHFVSALEHFWNDWASYRNDVILIVCGSATSWMIDNVINSRGGLHNRVTHSIHLAPFSLGETEEYFRTRDFGYDRTEVLQAYMTMGGVAYYLSLFENDKSVAENIDRLCFDKNGELYGEFDKIFRALYKNSDKYLSIVDALRRKRKGLTREEIIDAAELQTNGNITKMLKELEECDFVRSYVPFSHSKKETLYQLCDPFCNFFFSWMLPNRNAMRSFWTLMQGRSELEQWYGYAFEMVGLIHLKHIVKGFGIDGIINKPGSWFYKPSKLLLAQENPDEDLMHGAQVDLVIDRGDMTVMLCELKYSSDVYEIDKEYDRVLQKRIRVFRKVTNTHKSVMVAFITPFGLVDNQYGRKYPRNVVADDLFLSLPL